MAVFRVQKTQNYTVISNIHLRDKRMSLKGKGLLSIMLSLPPEWDFSIMGLVNLGIDKETAIKSTLKELENLGYLRIDKIYPNQSQSGRIEYVYNIFESPELAKQGGEKQALENLPLEILPVENPGQLNTKELNTYILNTKKDKSSKDDSQKPIISVKSKKSKKVQDILAMKGMINLYTENEGIRSKLLEYFNLRVKKGLQPNQWKIILEDLRSFAGDNANMALDKINNAIAGGYMQIIASWEKDKKNCKIVSSFDNTAGQGQAVVTMTREEKQIFEQDLVRDQSGRLIQF